MKEKINLDESKLVSELNSEIVNSVNEQSDQPANPLSVDEIDFENEFEARGIN